MNLQDDLFNHTAQSINECIFLQKYTVKVKEWKEHRTNKQTKKEKHRYSWERCMHASILIHFNISLL